MPKDSRALSQNASQLTKKNPEPSALTLPKTASELKAYAEACGSTVLLIDCSGSMAEYIEPQRSKWDAMCDIRTALLQYSFKEFFFNDTVFEGALAPPIPQGSTWLAQALQAIFRKKPKRVIVISDGEPNGPGDDAQTLRGLVSKAGVRVDVFFVGHFGTPGEGLLRKIAEWSGGVMDRVDLAGPGAKLLEQKIAGLLPKPR